MAFPLHPLKVAEVVEGLVACIPRGAVWHPRQHQPPSAGLLCRTPSTPHTPQHDRPITVTTPSHSLSSEVVGDIKSVMRRVRYLPREARMDSTATSPTTPCLSVVQDTRGSGIALSSAAYLVCVAGWAQRCAGVSASDLSWHCARSIRRVPSHLVGSV